MIVFLKHLLKKLWPFSSNVVKVSFNHVAYRDYIHWRALLMDDYGELGFELVSQQIDISYGGRASGWLKFKAMFE